MSSLEKMLSLLDLFASCNAALSLEEITRRTALPQGTCYRYVRALAKAGLLINSGGGFTLGHRIIQLDYQIRQADPLIGAARKHLANLARAGGGTAIACCLYNDTVLNIHTEESAASPGMTFGRGRELPLFKSSSSRVILASLSRFRLKQLFERYPQAPGRPTEWKPFYQQMNAIAKHGFAISRDELGSGLVGFAARIPTDSSVIEA
ncbi:MAG: IclR family transcriptional regulator, partial [Pigmentiphaga sp.]